MKLKNPEINAHINTVKSTIQVIFVYIAAFFRRECLQRIELWELSEGFATFKTREGAASFCISHQQWRKRSERSKARLFFIFQVVLMLRRFNLYDISDSGGLVVLQVQILYIRQF